ncbi:MAG: hypothetical protein NC918_02790 [Candidatus Omnitrophica bacterium]|nr:hypothetical protein [Candidatus Omnitrophota bacterium]
MKKSVVLIIVIGVTIILSILALVAIYVMTNESRIAEHKIKRIRAIFAARAGLVYALERLRREGTTQDVIDNINNNDPLIGNLRVDVTVSQRGMPGCPSAAPSDFCVSATVKY